MDKISFHSLAFNQNRRFTHFIEKNGDIVALYPMETLLETVVGVVIANEFPSDEQRLSICALARTATFIDPTVVMEFGEACSPFLAVEETMC